MKTDKYHGVGGSYVLDPATGERTRVGGPPIEGEPAAAPVPTPEAFPLPGEADDHPVARKGRQAPKE